MRLKKIAIIGFKSFADKTILNFDAGITCIVGPNGCGKSNISDAFRWVMGEQSAKSLRGSKMPDVIFSGSTHRKPLNFAEVSLTLTDIQGALPVSYDEVTVTRRLHRSGESEYLLNQQPVRLKDLQHLFLGSGIGRNAFSIFEQGKLDQVISYTPHERRHIFEEASGILRFLQRKQEALKKLEQAEINLSRVLDITQEVGKQIQTLEIQAEKAKVYKDYQKELDQVEKACYVLRWQGLEKKQTDLHAKISSSQMHLEEHKALNEEFQAKQQQMKQNRQQHEKTLRGQSELLILLRGKLEVQHRESEAIEQQLREGELKEKKLKQEFEDLILAKQSRQKMLGDLKKRRKELEEQWGEAESNWKGQQEKVKLYQTEVFRLRQELTAKQQSHFKIFQQHSQLQSDLKQTELRLQNLSERQGNLESRLKQYKGDWDKLNGIRSEKREQLQQFSDMIDGHKDRLTIFEDQLKSLNIEEDNQKKLIDSLQKKEMEMKARLKVLHRMRDDLEGFSSGSKRLLQETKNPESPFFKKLRPLYEWVQPTEEYAEAIAAILRSYSQTLVVEDEKVLKDILDFTEQQKLQDFSLLCIEWIKKLKNQRQIYTEDFFVNSSSNIIENHFLRSISHANSYEEIIHHLINGKCDEGWLKQGMFLDHRAVLFKIKTNENQVFRRESEIQTLEEELIKKEDLLLKMEKDCQNLQQRRSHLQLERVEVDKVLRRDEMKLVEVNFGLQRAISDLEKNEEEKLRGEKELVTLQNDIKEQNKAFQTLSEGFGVVKQELIQLQNEKEVLQQELEQQEGVLRLQENDQKLKGVHYQQLVEDRQKMSHQFQLLEAKEEDHDKQVERIEEELGEVDIKSTQLREKGKKGQQVAINLEKEAIEAEKKYSEIEKEVESLIKVCEQAELQAASHQEKLKEIDKEIAHMDIQLAHHRAVSQSVIEELSERFHLTIEAAMKGDLPLNRSIDQTEKRIKALRHAIQECGDVNLTAIEELEKSKERIQFLNNQINDLKFSKDELLLLIKQLEGESEKLFKETFQAIRSNFQKNFQILFNGGEADLHFTDSQNILESGIEITAKPPGKQMRTISLLSGGEKCLTAVALLFAIFEVRPAPFCILDEIDAPLDDTNVERFANVVKHFVDRCQFLIITHNKGTMAIADVLFGVSMEEKGVSKLLSLEFAHKEMPEASLVSS